jgi:hypothetical protein
MTYKLRIDQLPDLPPLPPLPAHFPFRDCEFVYVVEPCAVLLGTKLEVGERVYDDGRYFKAYFAERSEAGPDDAIIETKSCCKSTLGHLGDLDIPGNPCMFCHQEFKQ